MRLAIAMTAYNRPKYLREVIKSLAKNKNYEDYKLFFSIEPGNYKVIKIAQSVAFIEKEIHINPFKYGVRKNPYEMLSRVFAAGFDGVLYIEDDSKLAPDAINLTNWYFNRDDKESYLCLNLYNHDSKKENEINTVIAGEKFSALGVGITKKQWSDYFAPAWNTHPNGWDFSITDLVRKGAKVLQPSQSRSMHIGRKGGTYYRPEAHDPQYIHNYFFSGTRVEEFILI